MRGEQLTKEHARQADVLHRVAQALLYARLPGASRGRLLSLTIQTQMVLA